MRRSLLQAWRGAGDGRTFQLTRYFTATSLLAFVVLAIVLYLLELGEQRFFASAQRENGAFLATVQAQLLQEHKEAGRTNLVAVHEAGHVTLAHVFANAVWNSHFAPLVAAAQAVPVERCRAPALEAQGGTPAALQACVAELRRQVTALPGFSDVDAPVRALMRRTNVFKIKVYDLRGLTVYSSELAQVGEDKSENRGWRSAVAGRPASELVHRNRFSAFEGQVEDRDLIQSYVPVQMARGGIQGVFEIYSDVTPLLQQLDAATARLADVTTRNQERVQQAAERNQGTMVRASNRLLAVSAVVLVLVYLALLYLVRNGQRIIDAEARSREQLALREQEWHRDKMATMATMAANISHEVGNPLAIISGLAQEIELWRSPADFQPEMPKMIVDQTARISQMTRRISDFANAGSDAPEVLDINQLVRSVCEFLRFDRRFRGTPIELRPGQGLLACEAIPDHLTEVLMGLLNALEENVDRCGGAGGTRIVASTAAAEGQVRIHLACERGQEHVECRVPPEDARVASARRRLEPLGGSLEVSPGGLEIRLPAWSPPEN
ncbi:MAG TPA: histidine kinase dimerization/phospho-acceptor domain-containing protein [Ramlibacter sp.]|uniref:histidine kinase dimerization/phospho-acceptor domain-containing protein n=1 Tax=Ramlibacter sp. TaxID=1917967 RepID=UPI002D7F05B9|nr:histidine kinase dimerization/phospho-acceptor domain-containing protein [Ramlibacter sp.]HET8748558.1 histidine kinase dimerization/phospho-acceptor domain-containing protein [Ramlibacter sp.]